MSDNAGPGGKMDTFQGLNGNKIATRTREAGKVTYVGCTFSPVWAVLPPGDGVPSVRGYLVLEHLLPLVARANSGGKEQTLCGKEIKKT